MRRTKRIDYPMSVLLMRDQRANADNRVVNVFWKFVPEFGANFVIALAVVTIRRSEARKVGYSLDVPYENVGHLSCGSFWGCNMDDFYAADAFTVRHRKVLRPRVTFK
jgi:hypothetical protein